MWPFLAALVTPMASTARRTRRVSPLKNTPTRQGLNSQRNLPISCLREYGEQYARYLQYIMCVEVLSITIGGLVYIYSAEEMQAYTRLQKKYHLSSLDLAFNRTQTSLRSGYIM